MPATAFGGELKMYYRQAMTGIRGAASPPVATRLEESQAQPLTPSYWLLVVFIGLLYANLPLVFPASEVLHPAKILGGAGILAVLHETFVRGKRFEVSWPDAAFLLAFFAAAALSCLTALWPGYAFEAVSNLIKMVIVYMFLVTCATTERAIQGVMWTMVVGGLAPALGTIKNFLQGNVQEG
ncbi:MAG: hypothetical protein JO307_12960, partial [Bryobacterales bacterium]|nr:hypothetical protein [Bryobacterales bacterium]